jgi:hypothetical protein
MSTLTKLERAASKAKKAYRIAGKGERDKTRRDLIRKTAAAIAAFNERKGKAHKPSVITLAVSL